MEAKHTPGPWHESVGEIRAANGFCIATMEPPHPAAKGKDRAEHRSYQQANARLFAAAPDLLEACKAALAYDKAIRSCGNDPERMSSFCTASGEDLDTLYFSWVNKSRSAIAKAAGHHPTPIPDEAMAGEQEID